MAETTVAISLSALWCSYSHSPAFTHPDPGPTRMNSVFHRSMPSSAAGRIGCSDRRQRCSRCSNGTVPAGCPVLSSHLHLLPDTLRVQTSERLPSHLRIPTVLKRRRPRIRRRDEGEVVFFCEETCSSGIAMSKDLRSPRLPSISCYSTYCHVQPTNP